MEFIPRDIPDVILIKPKVYGDERGFFLETYREKLFAEQGIDIHFVQDNFSYSRERTVRGLHYQIEKPQAKLVMVPMGKVLDVAVDLRRNSPTFGKYTSAILSGENKHLLYIPTGFAHGFAVLSDDAYFQYKCSDYYYPEGERGVKWNDEAININWGVADPIISDKDKQLPLLEDVPEQDLFS